MSLAHTIQNMWPFRGVPDPRSSREIDDDLEAEFAFHLDQSSRDLIEQGCDRLEADRTARERFGDLERYKKQCLQIALKERIMLQRVNFVMMIVVMLMVVGVGVQVMLTQKHNTLALQDITTQIAKMRLDAAAEARDRGWGAPPSQPSERVNTKATAPPAGEWRPIDAVTLEAISDGGRLLVIAANDVINLAQATQGIATFGHSTTEYALKFRQAIPPTELTIYIPVSSGRLQAYTGRWDLTEQGHLRLNVSQALPQFVTPLVFERVGDGHELFTHLMDTFARVNSVDPTLQSPPSPVQQSAQEAANSGFIYIDGNIARPGAYALPQVGKLTLKRFFAAAGVPTDKDFEIVVSRLNDSKPTIHTLTMQELRTSPEKDFSLMADDRVVLNAIETNGRQSTAAKSVETPVAPAETAPDAALRSPFRGVKWSDWTPYVDVQTQWYELLTVDGIPISLLLDHCRNTQADNPRACFSERLVEALTALGRPVGDAMKLELRDPATGTRLSIDQAALTAQNHERVVALNKAAVEAGALFPVYEQSPPGP